MALHVKKNNFTFFSLFLINLFISVFALYILPDRFFNDTKIIVFDKWNEIGFFGSYPFTILFYKVTLLKHLPFPLIALIQYPLLVYILYKLGVPVNFHKINVKNILVYIAFSMMALFVSMPSKEFITFLFVSLVPYIYNKQNLSPRKKIIYALLIFLIFGSFFRQYYLIIPILAVGMYIVTLIKFKEKTFKTVFYGLIIALFLSFSHDIVKGEYLSKATREDYTTEQKVKLKINSVIESPISQETWYGESVGIFYGFFAVNIPLIEGLKHLFSPQIIAFILWQLLMFYILLKRLSWCIQNKEEKQFELWSLLILFSYFIVQGIFEPDLGTSTRHKIGFFPLIYYVLYYDYIRKDTRKTV
jgi:hypothetical protein